MSGPLAIAAVSAALRDVLQQGMHHMDIVESLQGAHSGDVPVSVGAPDRVATATAPVSQLNVFLYNVARNTSWANLGLPSRNDRGELVDNPALGLDLYYLLTAYGAKDFDAEVLLGAAMQILHDTPGLDRNEITEALANGSDLPRDIQDCGLADQPEAIRISPLPMSTEEIVRLWSAFQCNYRPSVAYLVSVVLLKSARSTRTPLPVRARKLYAVTFAQPRIDRIERLGDPRAAITPDATVRVIGANLDGAGASLLADGIDLSGGLTLRGATELQFTFTQPAWPDGLYPGVVGLQLVVPQEMGVPPVAHGGAESNTFPFVLAPSIAAKKVGQAVRITSATPIGKGQAVRLLLNELGAPPDRAPYAFGFDAPAGNGVPAADADVLQVDIPLTVSIPAGDYLARVRVDGAESPLQIDAATGAYATPKVTL